MASEKSHKILVGKVVSAVHIFNLHWTDTQRRISQLVIAGSQASCHLLQLIVYGRSGQCSACSPTKGCTPMVRRDTNVCRQLNSMTVDCNATHNRCGTVA